MTIRSHTWLPAFFCACYVSAQTSPPHKPSSGTDLIAFVHAAVVPMDKERVLPDQTVIVANGTIVEIGPLRR